MSTQPKPYISEEQYLEIEERSEQKSDYFQGEMFPMEASIAHALINDNLIVILTQELSGSGCKAVSNKMRLRVSKTGLYTYPDLFVICGKMEVSERDRNSVVNPTVIIEILSPSTEVYDCGKKFAQYRSSPSFGEYLLISQDRVHAEHHKRQPDGGWLLHETSDGETIIFLESVGVRFKLSEAYSGVEL